jgi:hypothetical protein
LGALAPGRFPKREERSFPVVLLDGPCFDGIAAGHHQGIDFLSLVWRCAAGPVGGANYICATEIITPPTTINNPPTTTARDGACLKINQEMT